MKRTNFRSAQTLGGVWRHVGRVATCGATFLVIHALPNSKNVDTQTRDYFAFISQDGPIRSLREISTTNKLAVISLEGLVHRVLVRACVTGTTVKKYVALCIVVF